METLGWLVFIFGGAYVAANIGAAIVAMRGGGLEAIGGMLVSAIVFAVAWVIFAFWISPFGIVISG